MDPWLLGCLAVTTSAGKTDNNVKSRMLAHAEKRVSIRRSRVLVT